MEISISNKALELHRREQETLDAIEALRSDNRFLQGEIERLSRENNALLLKIQENVTMLRNLMEKQAASEDSIEKLLRSLR